MSNTNGFNEIITDFSVEQLESAIARNDADRVSLLGRLTVVQKELANINSCIQGRRLPRNEYLSLIDEQNGLKSAKLEIEKRIAVLKTERRMLVELLSAKGGSTDDWKPIVTGLLESLLLEVRQIKKHLGIEE